MSQIKVDSIVPSGGLSSGKSGGIIQIVQSVKQDRQVMNSTSFTDISGLSASITPASTSNKIFLIVELRGSTVNTDEEVKIDRNGTRLTGMEGASAGNNSVPSIMGHFWAGGGGGNTNSGKSHTMFFLDSPASGDPLTYKVQLKCTQGYTTYINTTYDSANDYYENRLASSITLMEVSG
jgi:hypothetical protein